MDIENAKAWRIHTDYSHGDLVHNRYVIKDQTGVDRATGLRWKDATRILRALRHVS